MGVQIDVRSKWHSSRPHRHDLLPSPPMPISPDDLDREADRIEAEAAEQVRTLRAAANALRKQAGMLEAAVEKQIVSDSSLTLHADSTSIGSVESTESTALVRGKSKSKSKKHPFVKALYEHEDPKKRMTVTQWADKHGVKVPTVASWVSRGAAKRRIPMRYAKLIEKELGLPATMETWKNGILPE